jgi:hypothetical protein
MQARVYAALDGWRWRLWTKKGQPLAESGRAFASLESCHLALRRLSEDLAECRHDFTHSREGWRWRLLSDLDEPIVESDRAFLTRLTCQLALTRFVHSFNKLDHYDLRYAGRGHGAPA